MSWSRNKRTPTIKIKKCPECGEEVEIFSDEMKVNYPICGFTIFNDIQSCLQWCKYARECVGEELYRKLKKNRIAFVWVENSCRSQIADAVANKLCKKPNLEFLSGGTSPADEVDPNALKVLNEEGISWQVKPKSISGEEFSNIDLVVPMGCDVKCPMIPGARVINLKIPDPKGKRIEDYRKTLDVIREKIIELLKEV